ncbi:hypothetical protein [Methanolobus profundi]|uniref:hypothetical protein n=1 Tax=Methanolobus profundi TaxID=487685 RepID=UPI000B82A28A|nr:hypothetical protein [Methanolobus profundi]
MKEGLYRKATPDEIKEAGFYLEKKCEVRIISKKYSINKIVLKQSEIPNNSASSKNMPQVKIKNDNNRR